MGAMRATIGRMALPDGDAARELDCLTCGACCRTGHDGRILVPAEDLVRWRRIGREDLALLVQPGHFGEVGFATTDDGACVHLGTDESANGCRIYEVRGTTCREFEKGSWQCLEFRRDQGVDSGSDLTD
jgi:Fe-S-cluster containining protein